MEGLPPNLSCSGTEQLDESRHVLMDICTVVPGMLKYPFNIRFQLALNPLKNTTAGIGVGTG
jgi:hypothetical protein